MEKYELRLIVKSPIEDEDKFREAFYDIIDGNIKSESKRKKIIYDSYGVEIISQRKAELNKF
jgi:hypothetical protein